MRRPGCCVMWTHGVSFCGHSYVFVSSVKRWKLLWFVWWRSWVLLSLARCLVWSKSICSVSSVKGTPWWWFLSSNIQSRGHVVCNVVWADTTGCNKALWELEMGEVVFSVSQNKSSRGLVLFLKSLWRKIVLNNPGWEGTMASNTETIKKKSKKTQQTHKPKNCFHGTFTQFQSRQFSFFFFPLGKR